MILEGSLTLFEEMDSIPVSVVDGVFMSHIEIVKNEVFSSVVLISSWTFSYSLTIKAMYYS